MNYINDQERGLYGKFRVERTDGRSAPGEKHHDCEYFVLDLTHDKHALAALLSYAESCAGEFPQLAADLRVVVAVLSTGAPPTDHDAIEEKLRMREAQGAQDD